MATISSAAAPPALVIAKRAAAIAPLTRPRPYSDRNITPVCAVPDDLLTTGKEQLNSPRRRAGALYRASRAQLLCFPSVDQRKPNPAGTYAVFLQRDRVIEQLAHKAHVSIPPIGTNRLARRPFRRRAGPAPDTGRSSRAAGRRTQYKGRHRCHLCYSDAATKNPVRRKCRWPANQIAAGRSP